MRNKLDCILKAVVSRAFTCLYSHMLLMSIQLYVTDIQIITIHPGVKLRQGVFLAVNFFVQYAFFPSFVDWKLRVCVILDYKRPTTVMHWSASHLEHHAEFKQKERSEPRTCSFSWSLSMSCSLSWSLPMLPYFDVSCHEHSVCFARYFVVNIKVPHSCKSDWNKSF